MSAATNQSRKRLNQYWRQIVEELRGARRTDGPSVFSLNRVWRNLDPNRSTMQRELQRAWGIWLGSDVGVQIPDYYIREVDSRVWDPNWSGRPMWDRIYTTIVPIVGNVYAATIASRYTHDSNPYKQGMLIFWLRKVIRRTNFLNRARFGRAVDFELGFDDDDDGYDSGDDDPPPAYIPFGVAAAA